MPAQHQGTRLGVLPTALASQAAAARWRQNGPMNPPGNWSIWFTFP